MINEIKTYQQIYDDETAKMMIVAERIHNIYNLDEKHSLPKIIYALRSLYQEELIRDKFVKSQSSEIAWSKGFCGLANVEIFQRYGKINIWDFATVDKGAWDGGAVMFLLERKQNIPLCTVGEYYYPQVIPYHLGKIQKISTLKITSVNNEFKKHLDKTLAGIFR